MHASSGSRERIFALDRRRKTGREISLYTIKVILQEGKEYAKDQGQVITIQA